MRYRYDATRGSTAIDWTMASSLEPPLDAPEYWELRADREEELQDFLTSVEPD